MSPEERPGVADGTSSPVAWDDPAADRGPMARWRRRYADFWLRWLFWHAAHMPTYTRVTRPFYLWAAWRTSRLLRDGTLANARRLLPADATDAQRKRQAKAVVANFYQFICDVATISRRPVSELLASIEGVEGLEHFQRARALKRGAIVVTAHLGSFEAGLASLRQAEPRVRVVFQRDSRARFEEMRRALREKIGVTEAALDEGFFSWVALRDALTADEVVVIQGDRVMPGQRGVAMPFFNGTMEFPPGPVKLALATGAPIVPVFAPRVAGGKVRIVIHPMIEAAPGGPRVDADHSAMRALAASVESAVRAWPDQWLMLQHAWREDRPGGTDDRVAPR